MEPGDFKEFTSKQSRAAYTHYPLLDNIVVVQFRKGSSKMYWKEDIRLVDFQEGEFLQKTFVKEMRNIDYPERTSARGIPKAKKSIEECFGNSFQLLKFPI